MPKRLSYASGELLARTWLMTLFLAADLWMFSQLVSGFLSGDITPAVAGILSALVTAITGVLALGAKDFFNSTKGSGGDAGG